MSSSRVRITLTGLPTALATCTASTTKSEAGQARRPKPPPRKVVWNLTFSGCRPATRAAASRSTVWIWVPVQISAAVGLQIDKAVERLHRGMGEIGHLVLGLKASSPPWPAGGRIPLLAGDQPGGAGQTGVLAAHLRGRERRPSPFIPADLQQLTSLAAPARTVGDHRHPGIDRHHLPLPRVPPWPSQRRSS